MSKHMYKLYYNVQLYHHVPMYYNVRQTLSGSPSLALASRATSVPLHAFMSHNRRTELTAGNGTCRSFTKIYGIQHGVSYRGAEVRTPPTLQIFLICKKYRFWRPKGPKGCPRDPGEDGRYSSSEQVPPVVGHQAKEAGTSPCAMKPPLMPQEVSTSPQMQTE